MRFLAIGAHPDDCEIQFGGVAAKLSQGGHAVKFLCTTNGNSGHHEQSGSELARRRQAESQKAMLFLGIAAYEILDNHDGELLAGIDLRRQVIRAIRQWRADVVLGPRPNDYHPDHRYTGTAVQDAAYMVTVPAIVPEVPALKTNPVFLYFQDEFQKPLPFHQDLVISIDDVREAKLNALDAHVSQFYEWLPWLDGRLAEVPVDAVARKDWLAIELADHLSAEAFEICEYGRQIRPQELQRLFSA